MRSPIRNRNSRRGLAVLELVLSLPILLFMMATIVVFGTAMTWKYRAQVEARNIAWRNLWPRGGEFTSYRPPEWQAPRVAGFQAAGNVPAVDAAAFEMPVIRGPLNNFAVDSTLFDPTKGLDEGTSKLDRDPPMLKRMLPKSQFSEEHFVFDGQWQFRLQGMGNNFAHRINVLYQMPQPPQGLLQKLSSAAQTATNLHNSPAMQPLDNDQEFIAWRGSAPNFYPTLRTFTSLDLAQVDKNYVQPLVLRIEGGQQGRRKRPGVPSRMADAFLGLYQAMLKALPTPPPGLQQKIDELNAFKKKL